MQKLFNIYTQKKNSVLGCDCIVTDDIKQFLKQKIQIPIKFLYCGFINIR